MKQLSLKEIAKVKGGKSRGRIKEYVAKYPNAKY